MTAPAHVYETFVRAPIERVWEAIIDPAYTRRYFHGTDVASSFAPGGPVRYVMPDGRDAVEGVILEVDPPHRLVMSWRVLYDATMAAEPPSRVEWTLRVADDAGRVTRVTLRHGGLGLSPATWASVRVGWVAVLDGLKTLLETGEPLGDVASDDPPPPDVDAAFHRAVEIRANGETWRLAGDPGETPLPPDEAQRLLEAAYASAYHWRRAEGREVVHDIRAAWTISRAWVLAGEGGLALRYADRCLDACRAADVGDFDLAYAHEARARALASLGRSEEADRARAAARGVTVRDEEDRRILLADLQSGPWSSLDRR